MAETTINAPDSALILGMLESIDKCQEIQIRVQMITECFAYLSQFAQYFHENPEVAYSLRVRAKTMEESASELVITEEIDFDQAAALIHVTNQLLDITSYLAEYDCEEETISIPQPQVLDDILDF